MVKIKSSLRTALYFGFWKISYTKQQAQHGNKNRTVPVGLSASLYRINFMILGILLISF